MKTRISWIGLVGLACSALVGCSSREETISSQRQSNWREAAPEALAAAEPEPDRPISATTYFAAGQLFEKQGALQRAMLQYRKVLEIDPRHVGALNQLGMCYSRVGRYEEAEAYLRQAIDIEPNSAPLRNNLGFAYIAQRRWVEAENELRRALEIKPDFARARINLGMVLAYRDRHDEALEQFLTVLPEPEAYYNLGLLYRAQRQYAEAAMAFERALDLSPRFAAARQQLDTLKLRVRRTDQWTPNTGFDPLAQNSTPPARSNGASPSATQSTMTPVASQTPAATTPTQPAVTPVAMHSPTTSTPTKPVAMLTVTDSPATNTPPASPAEPQDEVASSEATPMMPTASPAKKNEVGELHLATPTPFYEIPVTTHTESASAESVDEIDPADESSPVMPQNLTGSSRVALPMSPVIVKAAEPPPPADQSAPAQPGTMRPVEVGSPATKPEPTGAQLLEQQMREPADDEPELKKGMKAQVASDKPGMLVLPMYPVDQCEVEPSSAQGDVQIGEMRPI